MKRTLLVLLSLVTNVAVAAEYAPAKADMQDCPKHLALKPDSMQTLDFLKQLFPGAAIDALPAPKGNFKFVVHLVEAKPNQLLLNIAFSDDSRRELVWDELMLDGKGKEIQTREGLCQAGLFRRTR